MNFAVGGGELELLADRAVWYARKRAILVADTHFGKDSTFRANAIPVPTGTTRQDLNRLDDLVAEKRADRLIILGDFFHSAESLRDDTIDQILRWRQTRRYLGVWLVRGNHDKRAGDPPRALEIEIEPDSMRLGPWRLSHYPDPVEDAYTIGGHVHPAVFLRQGRNAPVGGPCFVAGERRAILPAFGSFTGTAEYMPEPGDRIWLLGHRRVVEVPAALLGGGRRGRRLAGGPGGNLTGEESIPERRELL